MNEKVTKDDVIKQMHKFELLANLMYIDSGIVDVWWGHLKDWDKKKFERVCHEVEARVRFHILPTLRDMYDREPEPSNRFRSTSNG